MPSQSANLDLVWETIKGSSTILIFSLKTFSPNLFFMKLEPFKIVGAFTALNKFERRLEETFLSKTTSHLQVFTFLELIFLWRY